jgi:hypothetical protein
VKTKYILPSRIRVFSFCIIHSSFSLSPFRRKPESRRIITADRLENEKTLQSGEDFKKKNEYFAIMCNV